MLDRLREAARANKRVKLTLIYAVIGLPVCFLIQCALRGWDHWQGNLVFSAILVLVLGAGQYVMVRDPPPDR